MFAVFKTLHLLGVLLLFLGLGGMIAAVLRPEGEDKRTRRLFSMVHGVALMILLVAGFGSLQGAGAGGGMSLPGWVLAKIVIWLLLGAAAVAPARLGPRATILLAVFPVLGAIAAYLAVAKPF